MTATTRGSIFSSTAATTVKASSSKSSSARTAMQATAHPMLPSASPRKSVKSGRKECRRSDGRQVTQECPPLGDLSTVTKSFHIVQRDQSAENRRCDNLPGTRDREKERPGAPISSVAVKRDTAARHDRRR